MPLARISLILSRHFFLSFITFGRSSGLHPVSSHSCCMYVRAGHPAFAWPYAGVHRSTSLLSSSLLLKQCPACLVRLTCIVFVMGGKWPYSWCLVGCCCQDLFNIALNILYLLKPNSTFWPTWFIVFYKSLWGFFNWHLKKVYQFWPICEAEFWIFVFMKELWHEARNHIFGERWRRYWPKKVKKILAKKKVVMKTTKIKLFLFSFYYKAL